MFKKCVVFFLCFFPFFLSAQIKKKDSEKPRQSLIGKPKSAKDSVATVDMYKIITFDRDTTFVDTSLTLKKEYEVNYLRKDNFGLLPLNNDGQAYNILDFGLTKFNPFPEMGFKGKHYAYVEAEDVNYYHVATPYTDLMYRSVVEQGQTLDALITLNTSDNLNFALGYKGLRSLGRYINQLSSNGIFRFVTSYNTKDKRYMLRLHFTGQDFTNQENGGITNTSFFESGQPPYTQRERLDVYSRDGKSVLKGNRYFVDHTFRLNKDNPNSIVFHHQFNYENKFFEYSQPTYVARYGESYSTSINNKTRYNRMYNMLGAAYTNETVGKIEFYLEDFNYNYFYRSIIIGSNGAIETPNSLSDRINTYGARYTYQKDKWKGSVLFSNSITNQSLANIDASARYIFDKKNSITARYQNMNKLPDNNYTLYQSDYKNYNWPRQTSTGLIGDFKNEKINSFEFEAKTQWLNASVQYTIMNDHLYFGGTIAEGNQTSISVDTLYVTPMQASNTINYLSVKAAREFKFGKFALDNTFLYQNVQQTGNVLNVPAFVSRNTLYYSDRVFKNALFFQTGITFQYFTKYYANDYNPIVGEFYTQNAKKIGNFPLFDFFINAKIQEFRLFIKAEHLNSSFSGYNYYSTPTQPYKDFTLRFGVVWDFFS